MKEDAVEGAVGKAVKNRQPRKFRYDCENFAGIAKISQPQRKFRNPSEIGKFRLASEISLCSENHCA